MDKIMIQKFLDDAQTGYYSIATTIFGYWVLVTTAITNASRPSIMSKKGRDEELYMRRLKQLYAILFWTSVAAAVFFSDFGQYLIPLVYGAKYIPSVPAVIITMWYAPFSVLGTARGIWIICEDKNKYVKYYVIMGAIANLILNAALIPVIGIEGAALATFITQVFTCLIAPLFYKETRVHTKYVLEACILKGVRK